VGQNHHQLMIMKEVSKIVNKVKKDYPDYKFYATGSWVRNNPNFNDYDIIIIPKDRRVEKEWELILERFDNQEFDGKPFDVQIIPSLSKLLDMNAREINRIKDNVMSRYFYSKTKPTNGSNTYRVFNNLWMSLRPVVTKKHRARNLHKSPYICKEM